MRRSPTALPRSGRDGDTVRLRQSRLALAQAELALETLRSMGDDAVLFRAYLVATLAMLRRVGIVVHDEAKGNRGPQFAEWWEATRQDPLHVYVDEVRNPVVTLVQDAGPPTPARPSPLSRESGGRPEEVAPAVRWTFASGPYAGSDVLATLQEHLHWLERELVPGAEARMR